MYLQTVKDRFTNIHKDTDKRTDIERQIKCDERYTKTYENTATQAYTRILYVHTYIQTDRQTYIYSNRQSYRQ